MAKKRKNQGGSGGSVFAVLLVGTVLGIFALPLLVIFIAGMIPTLVAAIIDRDPEKLAPIAVGPLNFAGTLPIMLSAFQGGNDMAALASAIGSPFAWLAMYGGAAMGWLLYLGMPALTSNVVARQSERQIEKLIEKERELVGEWGPEVAQGDLEAPEPPSDSAAAAVDQGERVGTESDETDEAEQPSAAAG